MMLEPGSWRGIRERYADRAGGDTQRVSGMGVEKTYARRFPPEGIANTGRLTGLGTVSVTQGSGSGEYCGVWQYLRADWGVG
jgi:hypothetical protein